MKNILLLPHNCSLKNGSVVQLVRIRACHARGRGFESRPDRKKKEKILNVSSLFFYL